VEVRAIQFVELIWPIVGAVVAGGLIGAEREFRASPAGFRTHVLVALSSALLMLGAVHQVQWLTDTPDEIIRIDPVRMAHGILTGIGFLCGGVIFREGVTVRGLTTAASLWTTAALGTLFGVGFYSLAIGGTLAAVIVLAASNFTERVLPQKKIAELNICYQRSIENGYAYFIAFLARHGVRELAVSEKVSAEFYHLEATISWKKDESDRALVDALRDDPKVISFELIRH